MPASELEVRKFLEYMNNVTLLIFKKSANGFQLCAIQDLHVGDIIFVRNPYSLKALVTDDGFIFARVREITDEEVKIEGVSLPEYSDLERLIRNELVMS